MEIGRCTYREFVLFLEEKRSYWRLKLERITLIEVKSVKRIPVNFEVEIGDLVFLVDSDLKEKLTELIEEEINKNK